MTKTEIRGCLYILAGATLWGFSSTVAKALFHVGISPFQLVSIRLPLASVILLAALLLYDRRRLIVALKDIPYFVLLGTFGVVGNQLTFYFTMSKIQVGPAVLIQYIAVIWITLFAILFQKEPFSRTTLAAAAFALLGCYFVVGGYRADLLRLNRVGILSGVVSSFFVAFYALYGEKGLKRYDAWTIIFYGFALGGLFCWTASPPLGIFEASYPAKIWIAFLYIAIFATLIPFGLYFKGIDRLRATRASIIGTWEPVMSCITAYFILGEVLEPLQILGGLAVIAAVIVLQVGKEKGRIPVPYEIRETP